MSNLYKALTIAGSDTSGGAGLEADLKTFQEYGVYGMVALTVIVAQNPREEWYHEVNPIPVDLIVKQIITVCEGIGVDAMKTGMLGSAELVHLIAASIDKYKLKNVVIDPVMVCKGVETIMVPEAAAAIKGELVKRADVITPNTIEAAYLADMESIITLEDMKEAAGRIKELGAKNVVIKAGDRIFGEEAIDLLYDGKEFIFNRQPKIIGCYNHGAGCTFSAAVTAGLAKGMSVKEAVENAGKFVGAALKASFKLNEYGGALDHAAWRK